jgi:hypothetical protein
VFGLFGRPAHVAGSPAPAVGAAHQMLPIGKMLPIGQMLSIGQMLLIGKMLPIGQMLLIGRMLLILPAPAVGAAPHDIYSLHSLAFYSSVLLICFAGYWSRGRGRRSGLATVVDGGMTKMECRRLRQDGGSTGGVARWGYVSTPDWLETEIILNHE